MNISVFCHSGKSQHAWIHILFRCSSRFSYLAQCFTPPSPCHPPSTFPSLPLSACVSGRAGVCVCVSDACQMINPCFAGSRESRCMWLLCTTRCFGLCDTVSNPASSLVGLQECCEHCGFDRLTVRLPASFALLAIHLVFLCSSRRTVCCCLPLIHLLASLYFLLQQQEAVWQRLRLICMLLSLCTVCLSVLPSIHPSGAS